MLVRTSPHNDAGPRAGRETCSPPPFAARLLSWSQPAACQEAGSRRWTSARSLHAYCPVPQTGAMLGTQWHRPLESPPAAESCAVPCLKQLPWTSDPSQRRKLIFLLSSRPLHYPSGFKIFLYHPPEQHSTAAHQTSCSAANASVDKVTYGCLCISCFTHELWALGHEQAPSR